MEVTATFPQLHLQSTFSLLQSQSICLSARSVNPPTRSLLWQKDAASLMRDSWLSVVFVQKNPSLVLTPSLTCWFQRCANFKSLRERSALPRPVSFRGCWQCALITFVALPFIVFLWSGSSCAPSGGSAALIQIILSLFRLRRCWYDI